MSKETKIENISEARPIRNIEQKNMFIWMYILSLHLQEH